MAFEIFTPTRKRRYEKVDRFEVIDNTGRAYVKGSIYGSPVSIGVSLQDGGRTLKVFVTPTNSKEASTKGGENE